MVIVIPKFELFGGDLANGMTEPHTQRNTSPACGHFGSFAGFRLDAFNALG
jgi:hypothetical protein